MKEKEPTQKAPVGKREMLAADFKKSLSSLRQKIDGFVYPLIIPPINSIDEDALFDIYPDLRRIGQRNKLHVLLYSYGGDAQTAFHIGRLLQEHATDELVIYVLREAKSAATLIATAADKIVFSPISELGPMDPQIQRRGLQERFSPLAIKHTLELLASESALGQGHEKLAAELAAKLPDPLILGELLKSLETGKSYLVRLLTARMLKDEQEDAIKEIAETLVTGYPDHGYCIDFKEAKEIGLKVELADESLENELFEVMKQYKKLWERFEAILRDYRVSNENGNEKDASEKMAQATGLLSAMRQAVSEVVSDQLKSPTDLKDGAAK